MKEVTDGGETFVATAPRMVAQQVRERINGAWTGPFLIAWVFCNWRPIAVFLCSQRPVEERIQVIDSLYCGWGRLLLAPFAFALVYVVFCPILTFGAVGARLHCEYLIQRRRLIAENMLERDRSNLKKMGD